MEALLPLFVEALTPLLLAVLSWAGYQLTLWLKTKTKNELVEGVMFRAVEAATTAVGDVAQTYADAIKKASADGTLTREEAAEAKELAVEKAKLLLGPEGLKVLAKVLGGSDQLDEFFGSHIEQAVARRAGKF